VQLEHNKPLVFGKSRDKAISLNNRLQPQVVNVADTKPESLLVHDEKEPTAAISFLLANMTQPDFPEPVGVFRAVEQDPFDALVHDQIRQARTQKGEADLQAMLDGSESWLVN
jgi:2-oxoglutarate ferredoxin oxidoreductase subunit beta